VRKLNNTESSYKFRPAAVFLIFTRACFSEPKEHPNVDGGAGRNGGSMKKISTLAAVLLAGSVAAAYAQKSPGASEYSPGDKMHDQSTRSGKTGPGASQYAPGQKQTSPGGASELSPGDKMNDTRRHESR